MNEELQKQLLESLEKVTRWVEHAEAFTREQAPLVVQELLDYGYLHSLVSMCLALIPFAVTLGFVGVCWKQYLTAKYSNDKENWIAAMVAGLLVEFVFGMLVWWYASVLIQILIAPRVYVLEQLMSF